MGEGEFRLLSTFCELFKGGGSSGYYQHFEGELFLRKIARVVVVIMGNKKH